MPSHESQKHQKPPKKRNPPHISTFSPPISKAQPNRHLYHPQNTLPHPQKAPRSKRTQNDENRTKIRIFSAPSISPLLDNKIGPNLRWNRTRSVPIHTQKVPQVKRKEKNRKIPPKRRQLAPYTLAMDPAVHAILGDMKKALLECQAIYSRKRKTLAEIRG